MRNYTMALPGLFSKDESHFDILLARSHNKALLTKWISLKQGRRQLIMGGDMIGHIRWCPGRSLSGGV